MWGSGGCNGQTATTQMCEYVPPEKKQKDCLTNALNEALECCKNQELGVEEASIIYGIPKRTLQAKLKSTNVSVVDEKFKVFVLPVFPMQAETDLVVHLQDLFASQIPFSSEDVRRLGYELLCYKYRISGLPAEKNCILGRRWYKNFLLKYPHLDRDFISHPCNFYNALERFVNQYGITGCRIFFMDGIELKFRASNIENLKSFHQRKTIHTDAKAICCTNANGLFIPPVFLESKKNPEKNDLNLLKEDSVLSSRKMNVCDKSKKNNSKHGPTSEDLAIVQKQVKAHLNRKMQSMSEENEEEFREKLYEQFSQLKNKTNSKCENNSNEINHEIFYDWFSKFVNHLTPIPHDKVLLLLSDSSYVKYFKSLDLAKSSNVIFLVLPPHSSHKIHPLDGFTMSLHRNLSTCTRLWLEKIPEFKAEQVPLFELFQKAYCLTASQSIAKNGFLYSGIWPVNRHIFDSSELGGKSTLLRKISGHGSEPESISLKSDLKKFCRVCMKEKMYMKPLLDPTSLKPNYHGKQICELINVQILPGETLPVSLCQYCYVQLMDAVKIKKTATESYKKQLKLREAINRIYFEKEESAARILQSLFPSEINQQQENKIIDRIRAKNFDINSICRICMAEKPLMTSIFFKTQDRGSYSSDTCKKIMEVSHYHVHVNDGLSSSICPFCRASINQASEFIQKALNSDKRFREILSPFKN